MNISQYPTPERIVALMANQDPEPVVMVNLLKFKDHADAPDEGLTGEAAYQKYADEMIAFVTRAGGRVIWSGRVSAMIIGESDVDFDMIALVEYPSRQVFAEIVRDPHVQAIGVHRAAGLLGQWLIAAAPLD